MHLVHSFRNVTRGIASAAMAMSLACDGGRRRCGRIVGTAGAATDATSSERTDRGRWGRCRVQLPRHGDRLPGRHLPLQQGGRASTGRKIKFLGVQDDQDSPASETTDVQQLVAERPRVRGDPLRRRCRFDPADHLPRARTQTPLLGYGVEQAFCENKWAISIIGCQQSFQGWETTASIKQIIQASKKPASRAQGGDGGLRQRTGGHRQPDARGGLDASWEPRSSSTRTTFPLTGGESQAPFVQAILATDPTSSSRSPGRPPGSPWPPPSTPPATRASSTTAPPTSHQLWPLQPSVASALTGRLHHQPAPDRI